MARFRSSRRLVGAAVGALAWICLGPACDSGGDGGSSDGGGVTAATGGSTDTGGGAGTGGGGADTGVGAGTAGGGADTGGGGADTGGGGIGGVPSFDDDAAILAWSEAIIGQCPPVSSSTVPAGWQTYLVGDQGCAVRGPPGWPAQQEPGWLQLASDAEETAGYFLMIGWLEGTAWTAETIGDQVLAMLQQEVPDLTVLEVTEGPDPYGLGITFRVIATKFTSDGVQAVGNLLVIHTPCSAILDRCALTVSGGWTALAQLPDYACTVAQISASLTCPQGGGGCIDSECDASCKASGKAWGTCVGDYCDCAG